MHPFAGDLAEVKSLLPAVQAVGGGVLLGILQRVVDLSRRFGAEAVDIVLQDVGDMVEEPAMGELPGGGELGVGFDGRAPEIEDAVSLGFEERGQVFELRIRGHRVDHRFLEGPLRRTGRAAVARAWVGDEHPRG